MRRISHLFPLSRFRPQNLKSFQYLRSFHACKSHQESKGPPPEFPKIYKNEKPIYYNGETKFYWPPDPKEIIIKGTIDQKTLSFFKYQYNKIICKNPMPHLCNLNHTKDFPRCNNLVLDKPINLVIDSPGGMEPFLQILQILRNHVGYKTCYVKRADSAAAMIALSCDKIVLNKKSILGPTDCQYYQFFGLMRRSNEKELERISKNPPTIDFFSKISMIDHDFKSVTDYRELLQEYYDADNKLLEYVMWKHNLNSTSQKLLQKIFIRGDDHDATIKYHDISEIGLNINYQDRWTFQKTQV